MSRQWWGSHGPHGSSWRTERLRRRDSLRLHHLRRRRRIRVRKPPGHTPRRTRHSRRRHSSQHDRRTINTPNISPNQPTPPILSPLQPPNLLKRITVHIRQPRLWILKLSRQPGYRAHWRLRRSGEFLKTIALEEDCRDDGFIAERGLGEGGQDYAVGCCVGCWLGWCGWRLW